jgi:outer membrane protein assembly factor BamB
MTTSVCSMKKFLSLATAMILAPVAVADDWPHWMGPKRDNVWYETGILEKFPKDGPKKLWSFPVGGGYAGPAVVGDLVFITDYVRTDGTEDDGNGNFQRGQSTGKERVWCVNRTTGKKVWEYEYPVKYSVSYPAGPRCTPTVDGDNVYTLGAEGMLICFNKADGKKVWEKDLKAEYKTKSPLWGYAGHPLVDGDKLITLAGGEGSHVVALDKKTGKEIWKAETDNDPSGFGYVPPNIIEAGGKRQLIVVGPGAVKALDPETGKLYWKEKYTADNGSVIMTPILTGDYLFFGGYKTKNILIKLDKSKPTAKTEWKDKKGLGIHAVNVQPILVDGILYGHDESGKLFACEFPSMKRLWESTEPIGYAKGSDSSFIVKNGDRFFFFTETGDLVIGKLSKEGYTEIDRAKQLVKPTGKAFGRSVVWCQPAFANKTMYVRNDKELVAIDLTK